MMNGQQQRISAVAKRAYAALLFAVVCGDVRSSTPVTEAPRVRAASEGVTVPYVHPPIAKDKALAGAKLLAALHQGGHVLYLRHTQTGTVTPECKVSNLTPAGERDARFIGESIRKLRIPIGLVLTSPICRVFDSAKLLGLGMPVVTHDLSNLPVPKGFDFDTARGKRIAQVPPRGSNTMLNGHLQGGASQAQWINLDFGEIIVFRPDGQGGSEAVARIRADDWYDLMALESAK